jgi:hypothetical protein
VGESHRCREGGVAAAGDHPPPCIHLHHRPTTKSASPERQ